MLAIAQVVERVELTQYSSMYITVFNFNEHIIHVKFWMSRKNHNSHGF